MSGPRPSWRDIERGLEDVDDDPGGVDTVDVWRAFITCDHPLAFDGWTTRNAIRELWSVHTRTEIENMSVEEIEELDRDIYCRLHGRGKQMGISAEELELDPEEPGEPTAATDIDMYGLKGNTAVSN